jgi:hypothetical protein
MARNCHECGTELLEADDFSCQQCSHICPACAPEFVLHNATTQVQRDERLV